MYLVVVLLSVTILSEYVQASSQDVSSYLLSPFDRVSISVYGQPDLSSSQRISDAGAVSVPLLGDISIAGHTVSKAQKIIEEAFTEERYLVKPVVTVSIDEFSPKVVTVLGEVEKPGSIEIPPGKNNLAIQIVIAEAGGFTGAAQKEKVHVSRENELISNTKNNTTLVNVGALLEAKDDLGLNNYYVKPGDILFIPRRLF